MTVISREGLPILFSGPMVRAILDGRKGQTRRVLKWQFPNADRCERCDEQSRTWDFKSGHGASLRYHGSAHSPYFQRDLLWVRETWRAEARNDALKPNLITPGSLVSYDADYDQEPNDGCRGKTRVSIHMPRWASRLTLEVTAVKVERLQDISEEDALADGGWTYANCPVHKNPQRSFRDLWDSLARRPKLPTNPRSRRYQRVKEYLEKHPASSGSWEANPFVVAISFRAHRQNIDQFKAAQSAPLNMKGDEG